MAGTDHLDVDLEATVLGATGATAVVGTEIVQRLWGGYGHIVRCRLAGGDHPTVIVKHVRWPDDHDHPYGWTSDRSHERKVESYRVETAWYERHAARCPDAARVPAGVSAATEADGVVLVLEDLDASGYPVRLSRVGAKELDACVSWLAEFHAGFLGVEPDGLWSTGTYWHLDTRPDEFEALVDGPLKSAAARIDRRLTSSPFQTLVHGDAKLANFCFAEDGERVAAVDFQYVGRGCGMKDLAYFISSCFEEDEAERMAPVILDRYFTLLRAALAGAEPAVDLDGLEADWRALYPMAWADFVRFLQGWSPGHWKIHRYSEQLVGEVLASLGPPPADGSR